MKLKKLISYSVLLWCGFTLMGIKGCCTLTPSALIVGQSPQMVWLHRISTNTAPLETDSTTLINESVASLGYVDEYSFKVGPDATTDCANAAGYSAWTPKAQNLQADISGYPDGTMKLCLVGRGTNPCGELKTQLYTKANIFRWILDRAPGEFAITAPAGTVTTLTLDASWTQSQNADEYHLMITSDAACTSTVGEWSGVTGTTATISVPDTGIYYFCAEAMDSSGNITPAINSGVQFSATLPQEVVLKDHVTDNSCWNTGTASLYHYNDPGNSDGIVAAGITGGGGILKRVGAVFSDSDCNDYNAGHIENMVLSVAFYESPAVFQSDPYLQNQPQGSPSQRYTVAKLHTNPADPQYYLNPVRVTPSGTEQFYIEADLSSLNIQTTQGATQLVALWLESTDTADGQAWIALSSGCAGAVGAEADYYKSDNNTPALGPDTLTAIGAASANAAYFVSELR